MDDEELQHDPNHDSSDPSTSSSTGTASASTLHAVPPPTHLNQNHLNRLSQELRDYIWEYAVIDTNPVQVYRGIQEPGLLQASRRIRDETLKLYYSKNTFTIDVWNCDFNLANAFRSHMRRYVTKRPVNVELDLKGDSNWHNLVQQCRKIHSKRCSTILTNSEPRADVSPINGALKIAIGCRQSSWNTCKYVLKAYRETIGLIDKDWLDD